MEYRIWNSDKGQFDYYEISDDACLDTGARIGGQKVFEGDVIYALSRVIGPAEWCDLFGSWRCAEYDLYTICRAADAKIVGHVYEPEYVPPPAPSGQLPDGYTRKIEPQQRYLKLMGDAAEKSPDIEASPFTLPAPGLPFGKKR